VEPGYKLTVPTSYKGGLAMIMRFSDPFEALLNFQKQLDARLASDWLGNSTANIGAYPPINIFQQGDDFVAIIELPGVSKTDLVIEAKEGTLRISGKKTLDYQENASIHRRERLAGSFDRTITLPVRVDPDRIKAEYGDGILALFIPRAEADKPRSIEIK
jgi:HSP20 family protein